MKETILIIVAAITIGGCSKTDEFTPKEGADGTTIFKLACSECHNPVGGQIFILDEEMASVTAISKQVSKGSMAMPAFPNIKGEALSSLAQYVIDNSKVEK